MTKDEVEIKLDVENIDAYTLAELEEIYIDALWAYYREGKPLLQDSEYEELKKALYRRESRFPTLKRNEVAFVEASIAFYRGKPVISDEEYEALKAEVAASGRRKDVSAFLLYERGEQFLTSEQMATMKEEYEKLGIVAVDLDNCTVAQMEEMYVDAAWSYYHDGVRILTDAQFDRLKQELSWQASAFPTLSKVEVDFVQATLAYWRGDPVVSDDEWKELKQKVSADGKRKDITAFILYSKGKDVLDRQTFEKMSADMAKLGVKVKRDDVKSPESVTNPILENDLGQVFLMYAALSVFPVTLSTLFVWAVGLFLDWEFVPEPSWGALLAAEAAPLFTLGFALGSLITGRLFIFLDLQDPECLSGECPSCQGQIKFFNGGSAKVATTEYSCKTCGFEMMLDCKNRRILLGGPDEAVPAEPRNTWAEVWAAAKKNAKEVAKQLAKTQ